MAFRRSRREATATATAPQAVADPSITRSSGSPTREVVATGPGIPTVVAVPPIIPQVTIIAPDVQIDGTIKTRHPLRILGAIKGRVEAESVRIDEGAVVAADIDADDVMVAGSVSGRVVCRNALEIRSSGEVRGVIETLGLELETGAFIDGEVHMRRGRVGLPDPSPRPDESPA
jgi:cytoskeletal protein CcmA (bactofilin family)